MFNSEYYTTLESIINLCKSPEKRKRQLMQHLSPAWSYHFPQGLFYTVSWNQTDHYWLCISPYPFKDMKATWISWWNGLGSAYQRWVGEAVSKSVKSLSEADLSWEGSSQPQTSNLLLQQGRYKHEIWKLGTHSFFSFPQIQKRD